jgi:signal transduction histidine kinase
MDKQDIQESHFFSELFFFASGVYFIILAIKDTVKHKKLNIKIRVALVYSVAILLFGIATVLFLSFALRYSMNSQPVTGSIKTVMYKFQEAESADRAVVITESLPGEEGEYSITAGQLNAFLSSEIFRRMLRLSVIAVTAILILIFLLSYFLSKRLLKPLTAMAAETRQITAQKLDVRLKLPETDDELRQLSDSFNHTLDGLQLAFSELERFNAYASHELKNALAVMKTRLEVDYREGDCKETVRFAIDQVNRISKSISDILAISSTELRDSSELVDLALVAAQAADEYIAAGYRIVLDIPEEGVLPVKGKEVWFQRVIANLLDNAVKHSEAGLPIRIKVLQYCDAVMVTVEDSGKGIDSREQQYIWEPYFSSPDGNRGYGLGLAMVKHIVDICGGLVWVDSKLNKGSKFTISLPVVKT